jgi:hypothetical protein
VNDFGHDLLVAKMLAYGLPQVPPSFHNKRDCDEK